MASLSEFPVTRRWPPRHPERLQVYTFGTPNGVKIPIALEEIGLPYEAHRVAFDSGDQRSDEFRALNPNGKIPAILDPDGPGGQPLPLWESAVILQYLADKSGRLLPDDPAGRWHCLQWLTFQVAGIGPMFGQLGYFHHFDGRHIDDKRPRDRYANEVRRLLGVLDARLAGREWIMGDAFSVADVAIFPLVRNLVEFYRAGELVGYDDFGHVKRALGSFLARPAVQRGYAIPAVAG